MIIKKDSEIVKAKVERKSIALKAKKESSDEECVQTRYVNAKSTPWRLLEDSGEEDDEKVKVETCLVARIKRYALEFDLEPDEIEFRIADTLNI
ncbi:hypothetical protein Tco_0098171 [Tanacetum coccineum]